LQHRDDFTLDVAVIERQGVRGRSAGWHAASASAHKSVSCEVCNSINLGRAHSMREVSCSSRARRTRGPHYMQLLIYLRDNLLQFCGLLSGRGRTRTGREKGRLHKFDAQRDEWRVQARKCISISLCCAFEFRVEFLSLCWCWAKQRKRKLRKWHRGCACDKDQLCFPADFSLQFTMEIPALCSSCGIFWSGARREGGLLKSFECLFSNAACVLIRMRRCF
jgi:hypothetical protein